MPRAAPMMPAIIERVGTGKVSPPESMRAPERDAIGAASRIVNISGMSITLWQGLPLSPRQLSLPVAEPLALKPSDQRNRTGAPPWQADQSSPRHARCDDRMRPRKLQV